MRTDRKIQQEILERLAEAFPLGLIPLAAHIESTDDELTVIANALYLQQHGLIECGYKKRELVGVDDFAEPQQSVITNKGIDFLMDDGGLGAILDVVVVKLETTTIKALIARRIESDQALNHDEKGIAKKALESAGDQGIRKAVDWLMEKGLEATPDINRLIGMLQMAL